MKCADAEQHLTTQATLPLNISQLHSMGKKWSEVEHNRGIIKEKDKKGPTQQLAQNKTMTI